MRIVLAIDGSPSSDQAARLVASLPWPSGTSIALLTVYEIPTAWLTEAVITTDDWLSGTERALRREADARMSTVAEAFEGRDVAIERHVVRGRAATAILATAAELGADVIVVGSRGHGPITSMLLGSVSAEVAAQAPCSVLVVRSDHVGRLLVGADGSDCAAIIPDVLADWATFTGLPATAVSVTPVDSPGFELLMGLYTLGSESMASQREDLQQRHRHHAEAMAERLSAIGIPARPEVRNGDPAHEIVAAATDSQADLVVTGSRCLHGVDRWLLGSVARDVLLHTAASVLIIRQKGLPTAR
jgi:nucleotide-binding universal stress UspA family protein